MRDSQPVLRNSSKEIYSLTNGHNDVDDAIHCIAAKPEHHIAHFGIHVEH